MDDVNENLRNLRRVQKALGKAMREIGDREVKDELENAVLCVGFVIVGYRSLLNYAEKGRRIYRQRAFIHCDEARLRLGHKLYSWD